MAVNVYSKNELKKALKTGEKEIYVYGEMAKKLAKLNDSKKLISLLGGLSAAGLGILALAAVSTPITGGASLAVGLPMATHLTGSLGIVEVSLNTTEVTIIMSILGAVGIKVFVEICTKYDVITISSSKLEIKLEKKK